MKVKNNIITEGLSGVVAQSRYTFRQCNGRTILARRPKKGIVNAARDAQAADFAEARKKVQADYADPEKWAEWEAKAKASKRYKTAVGMAMAFYLAHPGN